VITLASAHIQKIEEPVWPVDEDLKGCRILIRAFTCRSNLYM